MYSEFDANKNIDFVIPWVDGSDKEWQKQKNLYADDEHKVSGNNGEERYRDWGVLRYWFRAVEKYAPWVRKVHFITCGHYPEWLNLDCKKLNFVKHEDYIPREWLPTFSSHTIELNIFRIQDLSEQFVYFNDDIFINAPVKPEDFFVHGLPRSFAALHPGPTDNGRGGVTNIELNDLMIVNEHFDFRYQFITNFFKWFNFRYGIMYLLSTLLLFPFGMHNKKFTGFIEPHSANSYLKATFKEVWDKENEALTKTSMHRFRDASDVNQWVMEYWQIAGGKFYPRSINFSAIYGADSIMKAIDDIKFQRHKIICINDGENTSREDFERASEILRDTYEKILPEESQFEL